MRWPRKIHTREMLTEETHAATRDRGDHFKVVGLKTLANIKKHSGRCFAIYLTFGAILFTTSTNITKTSTRVILSNIANMLNKLPEVATF